VIEGYIDFPLFGDGFEWTGGDLLIDVSWVRAAAIGNSPAVEVEEGLSYYATKSVQMTSLSNANHGNTLDDVPMTPGTEAFWTNTRPLTRFWTDLNTGFTPGATPTSGAVRYDAALDVCLVQPPTSGGITRLHVVDGLGRVVGQHPVTGSARVELPMGRYAPGAYTVMGQGPRGTALIGKVLKP
jgi:hypothetical protein